MDDFEWEGYSVYCDSQRIHDPKGNKVKMPGRKTPLEKIAVHIFARLVHAKGTIIYGKDIKEWEKEQTSEARSKKFKEKISLLKCSLPKKKFERDVETIPKKRGCSTSECGYRFRGSVNYLLPNISLPKVISEENIVKSGLLAIESAMKVISKHFDQSDKRTLTISPQNKQARPIDVIAQDAAEEKLREWFGKNIEIRGEESSLAELPPTELSALLDALDGTDLMVHNLGNWCSAMVMFNTASKPFIWAAFVGMPKKIFYMRKSSCTALMENVGSASPQELTVKANHDCIRDATICFYGQKPEKLLTMCTNDNFVRLLEHYSKETRALEGTAMVPKMRLYNLAGNPMMIKLILGYVDAIIELSGQQCHDVVPGCMIATKAGASLYNLESGQKITEEELATLLINPSQRLKYVLASNEGLAQEILIEFSKTAS